jgi:hypothetical protein
LLDTNDDLFVVPEMALAKVPLNSTHVRLVNFYDAAQGLRIYLTHGRTDSVTEIPCRFVRDAKGAADLVSTHAFAGLTKQVRAEKPFPERKVGVVEYGSGRHRKLVAASIAVVLVALHNLRDFARSAARAKNVVRPTQRLKVCTASVFTVELFDQAAKVYGVHYDL